jgi:hypothetical protein
VFGGEYNWVEYSITVYRPSMNRHRRPTASTDFWWSVSLNKKFMPTSVRLISICIISMVNQTEPSRSIGDNIVLLGGCPRLGAL